MKRLDDRRHPLTGIAAIKAESELKSALSKSRRGERKWRQALYPRIGVLILLFLVAFAIAFDATFGEWTGGVLCLFAVAIMAVASEVISSARR